MIGICIHGPRPIHLHEGLDLVVEFLYFGLVFLVYSKVVQQLLLDFKGFPTLMASMPFNIKVGSLVVFEG